MHTPFSISTHCLAGEELSAALEILSNHTEYIEVMNEGRHYTENASLLAEYPLHYSIHAPTSRGNIASAAELIRADAISAICASIDLAAETNAERVVFHPGNYSGDDGYEKSLPYFQDSVKRITKYGEDAGVPVCIENMGSWRWIYLQKPEELPAVDGTDFCLDIGHAHLCGVLDQFLEKPFVHIHIHDNAGEIDSHGAVGTGTINIEAVMKAVAANHIKHPVIECGTLDASLITLEKLNKLSQ
ncbi:MAG TPA: sugar phosphate isomerase/epimerase [Methanocorpusculum sp.]|nr:sugar phosphate isomerase/epimerase [Methanocorpusculum sp.]